MPKMADIQKQAKVSTLHKLYGDRYDQAEAICLLKHHDWDEGQTLNFIQESEPRDVRKLIQRLSGNETSEIKKDEDAVMTVTKGLTTAMRQFSCSPCDQVWWKKVPINKPVSKCKLCRTKYDPVPKEMMWGWAIFKCECGKEFSGFGQMGVTRSECYTCGASPYPSTIRPPNSRRPPKSKLKHKCDAPDCPGCGHSGNDAEEDSDVVKKCVHPRSRIGKPKVVFASEVHVSTGSTISSFTSRDQDELCTAMRNTSLSSIREHLK